MMVSAFGLQGVMYQSEDLWVGRRAAAYMSPQVHINLPVGGALSRCVREEIRIELRKPDCVFFLTRCCVTVRRLLSMPRQRPTPHHLTTTHQPPPSQPTSPQPASIHTNEALQIPSNHILRSFLSCILIAPLLSSPF